MLLALHAQTDRPDRGQTEIKRDGQTEEARQMVERERETDASHHVTKFIKPGHPTKSHPPGSSLEGSAGGHSSSQVASAASQFSPESSQETQNICTFAN